MSQKGPENTRELARAPVARNALGHFLPGQSGNVAGRPREERELRELARSYGAEAIERLVHLMRSAEDERVQLGAAEALLTRGYGRPTETPAGPLVALNFNTQPGLPLDPATVYQQMITGSLEPDPNHLAFATPVPAAQTITVDDGQGGGHG